MASDIKNVMASEEVMNTIRENLKEVVGDDYDMLEPVERYTSFNSDLELDRIKLVALSERIQALYGEKVNLLHWMSKKTFDEMVALTVGDLVDFITK